MTVFWPAYISKPIYTPRAVVFPSGRLDYTSPCYICGVSLRALYQPSAVRPFFCKYFFSLKNTIFFYRAKKATATRSDCMRPGARVTSSSPDIAVRASNRNGKFHVRLHRSVGRAHRFGSVRVNVKRKHRQPCFLLSRSDRTRRVDLAALGHTGSPRSILLYFQVQ